MAQVETGIRQILKFSSVYNLLGIILGSDHFYKQYVSKYIKPSEGIRILDIGCGTANILKYLPESITYTGFDLNPNYIESARKEHENEQVNFICSSVKDFSANVEQAYDLVLATAVLHHLDDEEATGLFQIANNALKMNGRFITLDCVYIPNQNWFAKSIISLDRGLHIRNEQEYLSLAQKSFPETQSIITHDLLNVPYTHIILEGKKV